METVKQAPPASFPLLDDIVVLSDSAMRGGCPTRIVPALVEGLRGLLGGELGALPDSILETAPDSYARRELYHSPQYGYRVFALTWAPGQESPIHDHADTWGVEAVLQGELDVVDYRSVRQFDALTELRAFDRHALRQGDVIGLLPPHDLHTCRNLSGSTTTVSLHIYGRELDRVRTFVPISEKLYRQEQVLLSVV